MTAQSAILPPSEKHARFLTFNLKNLGIDELKEKIQQVLDQRDLLLKQHDDELRVAFAFGQKAWELMNQKMPNEFHNLEPIQAAFEMPAEPIDILVHAESSRADLCFALVQTLCFGIEDKIDVIDEYSGFRYFDKRDLTGFIDGTENPFSEEERAETALLKNAPYQDGSFVFSQRYVHHLQDWRKLTVLEQEDVFGRTKLDSVEMDDDAKPDDAHIKRVVIEDDDGNELPILRHSLPYGAASGEQGLFFLAYTCDLSRIDTMLHNMFGSSEDGLHDHMLKFTTPVNGTYYFAPSLEMLEKAISE